MCEIIQEFHCKCGTIIKQEYYIVLCNNIRGDNSPADFCPVCHQTKIVDFDTHEIMHTDYGTQMKNNNDVPYEKRTLRDEMVLSLLSKDDIFRRHNPRDLYGFVDNILSRRNNNG